MFQPTCHSIFCILPQLTLSYSSFVSYRVVFAVQDSLCSVLIFLFVLFHWPLNRLPRCEHASSRARGQFWPHLLSDKWALYVPGALLGSLSLPFLYWGTVIPEDKGFEIFLMVGASLCCLSRKAWIRVHLGPAILGLSVAFKGLGVFLAPWYLYRLWNMSERKDRDSFFFSSGPGFPPSSGFFLISRKCST